MMVEHQYETSVYIPADAKFSHGGTIICRKALVIEQSCMGAVSTVSVYTAPVMCMSSFDVHTYSNFLPMIY
jgi:hypothetical protein